MLLPRTVIPRGGISVTEDEDYKCICCILDMCEVQLNEGCNKMSNYTVDTNESFCFLFPTDLLFEGFIGGFLKEVLQDVGGKVHLQESKMSLVEKIIYKGETSGAAFTMRHDILAEYHDKVFVLDTKYKEMSRFEDNPDYRKPSAMRLNKVIYTKSLNMRESVIFKMFICFTQCTGTRKKRKNFLWQ